MEVIEDPKEELRKFVKQCGSLRKAAQKLGLPYSTLHMVMSGKREIGKKTLERLGVRTVYVVDTGED